MRDPKRIKIILKELEKIWEKYPDIRFGQFLLNVFSLHNGIDSRVYQMEDEDFLEEIKRFYKVK